MFIFNPSSFSSSCKPIPCKTLQLEQLCGLGGHVISPQETLCPPLLTAGGLLEGNVDSLVLGRDFPGQQLLSGLHRDFHSSALVPEFLQGFLSPSQLPPHPGAPHGDARQHRHSSCHPSCLCLPSAPGAGSTAPFHLASMASSSGAVLALGPRAAGGQWSQGVYPIPPFQKQPAMESQSPQRGSLHAPSLRSTAALSLVQTCGEAGTRCRGQ